MSTDINPHLPAVVPVTAAAFAWVLHGKIIVAGMARRNGHRHFAALR